MEYTVSSLCQHSDLVKNQNGGHEEESEEESEIKSAKPEETQEELEEQRRHERTEQDASKIKERKQTNLNRPCCENISRNGIPQDYFQNDGQTMAGVSSKATGASRKDHKMDAKEFSVENEHETNSAHLAGLGCHRPF